MVDNMNKPLFAAPLCLLCMAAVLSASLPAALLLIAALSGVLLLTMLAAVGTRAMDGRWRLTCCLVLDALLGVGIWQLLARQPLWQTWAGPALLFLLTILLCAPVALRLAEQEAQPSLSPLSLLRAAGVLLLTGAARELLSSGTLFRVRLFPTGLSDSFALGAAGVLTAGVLLLFCGVRGRHFYAVPLRRGGVTSLAAGLYTVAAGIIPALLVALYPAAPLWLVFPLTAAGSAVLGVLGCALCKRDAVRAALSDGVTTALAIAVTANAAYAAGQRWVLLAPVLAGALLALALWLWTGIYSRIDSMRMPDWARGGPAVVVTAGLCLLAFSVLA